MSLALFDPDEHSVAVNIGDPQPHDFRDPQAGGIGRHQRGAMLQARHRREKSHDLVGAQDHRQLLLLTCIGDALKDRRGAAECDAVEEAQGADRDVEAGPRDAGCGEERLDRLADR